MSFFCEGWKDMSEDYMPEKGSFLQHRFHKTWHFLYSNYLKFDRVCNRFYDTKGISKIMCPLVNQMTLSEI